MYPKMLWDLRTRSLEEALIQTREVVSVLAGGAELLVAAEVDLVELHQGALSMVVVPPWQLGRLVEPQLGAPQEVSQYVLLRSSR